MKTKIDRRERTVVDIGERKEKTTIINDDHLLYLFAKLEVSRRVRWMKYRERRGIKHGGVDHRGVEHGAVTDRHTWSGDG